MLFFWEMLLIHNEIISWRTHLRKYIYHKTTTNKPDQEQNQPNMMRLANDPKKVNIHMTQFVFIGFWAELATLLNKMFVRKIGFLDKSKILSFSS